MTLAIADKATLPATYLAARNALANCERVDECNDWANKAAALASYAKQSRDDSLVIMAQRIQARAIRRCGELLAEVPALKGVKQPEKAVRTRQAVAASAGITPHRMATALRVAAIPRDEFEARIEADKPPSITELSGMDHGRKRRAAGCCPTCGRPFEDQR